jgi:hypothetical protein
MTISPVDMTTKQVALGQHQIVNGKVLPTAFNGGSEKLMKHELTKIGFVFGNVVDDDPMFQSVELPAGWSRVATGHPLWSHILDEYGRERISIFFDASLHNRDAFFDVIPAIQVAWNEQRTSDGIKMTFHIKKCGVTIFSADEVEVVGDSSKIDEVRWEENGKVLAWASKNYPYYLHPYLYWD